MFQYFGKDLEKGKPELSFFTGIRSMLLFARFLGTFPLGGIVNDDVNYLNFSIWSVPTLWSVLLVTISMGGLVYANERLLSGYLLQNTDFFWKVTTCWLLAGRSLLQFFFCLFGARSIPELFRILNQSYFCLKSCRSHSVMKRLMFALIFLHLGVIMTLDYFFFESLFPHAESIISISVFFSVLRVWQIVPTSMYTTLVKVATKGFEAMDKELRSTLAGLEELSKKKEDSKSDIVLETTNKIEFIRLECSLLQKACGALSRSFGTLLMVDCLAMTLILVVQLYCIVMFKVDVVFILCAANNFFSGIGALFISHALTSQSEALMDSLRSVPLLNMNPDAKYQIRIFQQQIATEPVKISAGGFFVLNKRRIMAMMGTVATYLIVLLEYGDIVTREMGVKD